VDELEIDKALLTETFLAEAGELLAHMEQTLVALEACPQDDELLHALFRDAHTLKGGAALVGFDAVKDIAHDVEDVLERLRKRTLAVTDALVTTLLRSVDVLRWAVGAAGGSAHRVQGYERERVRHSPPITTVQARTRQLVTSPLRT
jgi:two-component system chemotaxis sensor kinase CheA